MSDGVNTEVTTTIHDEEKGLNRMATAVTMSPELFEKLYLTPKVPHVGDYNRRFANPTPLGFVGFVMSVYPFSMVLMGWGGAVGTSPLLGIFLFTGPVLLLLATIFEWIMGNFFPMMAMGLFTVFWLSFSVLQVPSLGLGAPYATDVDPTGTLSSEYNAAVALYLLVWGFGLFTFFFFTLKVNVVFATIFCLASTSTFILSGAYWKLSAGDFDAALKLQKTGGAILFVVATLGWYMCFIIMAGEMRIPIRLPVGDLSHLWPNTDVELGSSEKQD